MVAARCQVLKEKSAAASSLLEYTGTENFDSRFLDNYASDFTFGDTFTIYGKSGSIVTSFGDLGFSHLEMQPSAENRYYSVLCL